jgi:hypothetical protein
MLLDLERTGPQQPALAVWDQSHRGSLCSGAATERQPLRFVGQRMVLFFGQMFRSETHAYMRAAERLTAVTQPWTALLSSAPLHPRLIGTGVNPHSCELGTETMPLRTAERTSSLRE